MEEKDLLMEEQPDDQQPVSEQPAEVYQPRPQWQVWAARIGLVIVIIAVILYYCQIAWGGR